MNRKICRRSRGEGLELRTADSLCVALLSLVPVDDRPDGLEVLYHDAISIDRIEQHCNDENERLTSALTFKY